MTFCKKQGKTGWFIGGGIFALMMILLAESATLPRNEAATSGAKTTQKDYRPILQNIKIIPEHLIEEKSKQQTLLVKRLSGVPELSDGPMAILSQMEGVHTSYLNQFDISAIMIPATWDTNWLLEIIEQDRSVKYAYKEQKAKSISATPDDPAFENQTNLHDPDNDVDIDAPEAWAYTTGSDSVVVAVLDSGALDTGHADLRPNLWVNSSEIRGNEIDDDMNGCTDDIHGCKFSSPGSLTGNIDGRGTHGTEVSSILARGNNNYAITGVIWNTRIMFLQSSFMRPLNYVMNMRDRGVNVKVINHSRILDERCDPLDPHNGAIDVKDAIEKAGRAGILFVQGIGNDGLDFNSTRQASTQINPGCLKTNNMIVVAGQSETSRTRWVDPFGGSNYGNKIGDLYAPAENQYYLSRLLSRGYEGGGAGTSYATPHVAAAAALLWSFRPDLTVTQVRSALLDTVDRFDTFKEVNDEGIVTNTVASGGALNIANALYSVATPGIRIHSSQTTITEGTSGYIDLSLTREPVRPSSGEVVVLKGRATPLSDATAIVTPSTLTFTSANWHIPQRMSVRAAGTSGSEITLQVSVDQHLSTTHYQSVPMRTATMTLQSDGIRPTLHMPARIAEGDTATATIRFSDPLVSDATFDITATGTGTAVEGTHYTLPETITAEAGSTSATFTITTIEEAGYNGPDNTIHLQINTNNDHILRRALPLQATLTIEDRDTPIMTITVFPRTITQSNIEAMAPTATATIQLDRMAVSDVRVFLHARPIGGGDINHLFYNISDDLNSNAWPASATIVENATATEIIIHSLDYDDVEGRTHWIRLSLDPLRPEAAARLGQPNRALLITRDDDGDSSTYIRLRVFLEGAVSTTPTDTTRADP